MARFAPPATVASCSATAGATPARPRTRRPRDLYGLELTTGPEAATVYGHALERLLSLEDGAEELLLHATRIDPTFALGHAVTATVLAERGAERDTVRRHIHDARQSAHLATEREASFVTAAVLWCSDGLSGDASLIRHVRTWPRDAYAVSLLTPSIASAGVSDGVVDAWSLLDDLVPCYADDWWLTSIRAFAKTEQGRWSAAEDLATAAMDARPGAGHAAHAFAHALYETGRHDQALRWLDAWMDGPGHTQRFSGHFAWHAAVVELALGDVTAARQRFDRELAVLRGSRALVDAGSLLARAVAHGHTFGLDRAAAVNEAAGSLATEPASPFLAWHAAVLAGLRADIDLLAALEDQARRRAGYPGPTTHAWSLVVSVCRALRAALGSDHATAAALLASLGDTAPMGGSAAQRELIDDLMLRCLVEAGEPEAAGHVAATRLARRASAFDLELYALAGVSTSG